MVRVTSPCKTHVALTKMWRFQESLIVEVKLQLITPVFFATCPVAVLMLLLLSLARWIGGQIN